MTELIESRCAHDMLEWPEIGKTSCSICKGLPWEVRAAADVPALVDEGAPVQRLRWYRVAEFEDRREACARCEEPLRSGQRAAWSRDEDGSLCETCAEAVA